MTTNSMTKRLEAKAHEEMKMAIELYLKSVGMDEQEGKLTAGFANVMLRLAKEDLAIAEGKAI